MRQEGRRQEGQLVDIYTVILGYGRPFRTLFRDVIFQNVALTRMKPYSIQSRKNNVCFLYEVPELISIHTIVSPLLFSALLKR